MLDAKDLRALNDILVRMGCHRCGTTDAAIAMLSKAVDAAVDIRIELAAQHTKEFGALYSVYAKVKYLAEALGDAQAAHKEIRQERDRLLAAVAAQRRSDEA